MAGPPQRNPQIFCPKCGYRPTHEDRWVCTPTCATSFHTFWTGGVCPGCQVRWPKTQCPKCDQYSPHKAWYHPPTDEEKKSETDSTLAEPVTARAS